MSLEPDRDEAQELLRAYVDGSPDALQTALQLQADLRSDPETMWRFLLLTTETPLSRRQLSLISAGPFEDFLADYGEQFFDRLSETARRKANMRLLLSMVWRGGIAPALWERVTALRTALGIRPE